MRSAWVSKPDVGVLVGCGDSIIAGFQLNPGQAFGDQANNQLGLSFANIPTYFNTGVSGYRSDQVLGLYAGTIAPNFSATARFASEHGCTSALLVEVGTNDFFQGYPTTGTAVSTCVTNAKTIIADAYATGFQSVVLVFVGKCFQVGADANYETNRLAYNASWSSSPPTVPTGKSFQTADWTQDPNFQTNQGLWQNTASVHPNAAGASLIGRTYVAPALVTAIRMT